QALSPRADAHACGRGGLRPARLPAALRRGTAGRPGRRRRRVARAPGRASPHRRRARVLTGPGTRARSRPMPTFMKVAAVGDVPPGTGKCIEAGGKQIALFNVGGTFHAIDNTCLHRGGPLGECELEGYIVTCPRLDRPTDVT